MHIELLMKLTDTKMALTYLPENENTLIKIRKRASALFGDVQTVIKRLVI